MYRSITLHRDIGRAPSERLAPNCEPRATFRCYLPCRRKRRVGGVAAGGTEALRPAVRQAAEWAAPDGCRWRTPEGIGVRHSQVLTAAVEAELPLLRMPVVDEGAEGHIAELDVGQRVVELVSVPDVSDQPGNGETHVSRETQDEKPTVLAERHAQQLLVDLTHRPNLVSDAGEVQPHDEVVRLQLSHVGEREARVLPSRADWCGDCHYISSSSVD